MKINLLKSIAIFIFCFLQIGLLAQTTETDKSISIFPNPMQGKSTVSFDTKLDGFAQVYVYGIDGKMIVSTSKYLQAGKNSFSLFLPKGIFVLKVNGIEYSNSVKVISNTSSEISPMLAYIGIENNITVISNSPGIMRATTAITIPEITTLGIISVGPMYIVSGGNILNDGGSPVTKRGICWNTTPNPTINNNKSDNGSGIGTFYYSTGACLTSLTAYYIRAYAINDIGVAYGNEISVMTINGSSSYSCPTVNTVQLMSYGNSTATINGNVTSQGGPPVTERGVCWSTHPITTLADSKNASGSGLGSFYGTAFNLKENTTYYIRAYATNQVATTYGSELSFRTSGAKIGDSYNGGVIAYFYQPGDDGYQSNARLGIMVTPSDIGATTWAVNPNMLIGAQKTGLGSAGIENTVQIVSSQGSGNYAAYLCQSSGWYLPTKDELNKFYLNRSAIGGFSSAKYWSSSEGSISNYASCQDFSTGSQTLDVKNNTYKVRGAKKIYLSACVPIVRTTAISSRTSEGVVAGGNVPYYTGSSITASGVCWSTNQNPTTADNITTDGSTIGSYSSSITGLTYGQTYYVRAYATNSLGTGYGEQVSFTYSYPQLTTTAVTSITRNTAITGGTISTDGGQAITARGVCWSTSPNPTTANSKTSNGTGIGTFTSSMTGLISDMTYYVRAYVVYNNTDIEYGAPISFKTLPVIVPTLTVTCATSITSHTATSGGSISDDGGTPITARGVCWSTSPNPTTVNSKTSNGTGKGSFISSITGLLGSTTYYLRAYATNSAGTAYSEQCSFTTAVSTIPTVTLAPPTTITLNSATCNGNVTSDGGSSVTSRGVCWSTSSNPTINNNKTIVGTGTGSFSTSITGLTANTTYYVRAYATNSVGTAYSEQCSFITIPSTVDLTVTSANVFATANYVKDNNNLSYSAVRSRNTQVAVSFDVKNQGTAKSLSAPVRSYFSSNATFDSNDAECTSGGLLVYTGDIDSGNTVSLYSKIDIPQTSTSGWYYIITVVDSTSNVESNNTNNTLATKIYVYGSS